MFSLTHEEVTGDKYYVELTGPSEIEIKAAWDLLCEVSGKAAREKVSLRFSEPLLVRVNSRKEKELNEAHVKLFISQGGYLCYTFYSRSGYAVSRLDTKKITRIEMLSKEKDQQIKAARVLSLLDRFHPNVWDELRMKIGENPEDYTRYGLSEVSINSVFGDYVVENIKGAFDNKTNYSYKKTGVKRDRDVEIRLCDDGILRAWYSSQYAGMLNGAYYVLINPRVATFCEYD